MAKAISLTYTTFANLADAEALAEQAIQQSLAKCVNIIPGGVSIYPWEGKLERGQEVYALFKSPQDQQAALAQWLEQVHPYDVPAIIQWRGDSSDAFAQYIGAC